jgi:hypothetical protein
MYSARVTTGADGCHSGGLQKAPVSFRRGSICVQEAQNRSELFNCLSVCVAYHVRIYRERNSRVRMPELLLRDPRRDALRNEQGSARVTAMSLET